MIGRTNINGTNDASGVGAVLSIDAPTGSTVTVSQGSFSKVLRDSIEINAYLSRYFYLVKPSRFGSWMVTATDGTDTASDTVLVTSNKEYEVVIHYRLYIIKDGLFQNGFSFLYSLRSGHIPTTTENYNDSGYLMLSMGSSYATGGVNEHFDITDYSTLYAQAYKNNGNAYVGIWPGYNYASQSAIESAAVAKTAVPATSSSITVDISTLTGEYYIGGCILADYNYQLFISDMWLE